MLVVVKVTCLVRELVDSMVERMDVKAVAVLVT